MNARRLRLITYWSFAIAALLCGRTGSAQSSGEISGLITNLGAPEFRTRLDATSNLRALGDAAIGPLQAALETDVNPEARLRIQSLLKELERKSFRSRLERLADEPTVGELRGLPFHDPFFDTVDVTPASAKLYVRILRSEVDLFNAVSRRSRDFSEMLESRASELLRSSRDRSGTPTLKPFRVESYAAVLLLAADPSVRLVRGTSTAVSNLLHCSQFAEAIGGPDGAFLKKLAGRYILRQRIAVVSPLRFARIHKLPEGPVLARRVLRTAVRGDNALYAMMLLLDHNDPADIPLLEQLFTHQGPLFRGFQTKNPDYSVLNGDLALAVAIVMRGKDPRDFGFAAQDDRSRPYRFVLETTGFDSETAREAAHAKYRAEFTPE